MDGGRDLVGSTDDVVAVFITMDLGYHFLPKVGSEVNIQAKWYPKFNGSSFILWLFATSIEWFVSWWSAGDYRRAKYKLTHPERRRPTPRETEMTS